MKVCALPLALPFVRRSSLASVHSIAPSQLQLSCPVCKCSVYFRPSVVQPLAIAQNKRRVVQESNIEVSDEIEMDRLSIKKWLLMKPSGFGMNNIYDTTLEDKILEEIERDKKAQAAALLRKKTKDEVKTEQKRNSKIKGDQRKTKDENASVQHGVLVKIENLPKKKNIHRDLQLAFKNVQGLLHINPSVLGNEKTRDPICKGFGFLTFQDVESAQSFVSAYQDEAICFGRIHKKISYKLEDGLDPLTVTPFVQPMTVTRLRVRDKTALLDTSLLTMYKADSLPINGPAEAVLPPSEGALEERSKCTSVENGFEVTNNLECAGNGSANGGYVQSLDEQLLEEEEDRTEEEEKHDNSSDEGACRDDNNASHNYSVQSSHEQVLEEEEDDDSSDNEEGYQDDIKIEVTNYVNGVEVVPPRAVTGSLTLNEENIKDSPANESEKRIEELEKRILQKFLDAGFGPRKPKEEERLGEKPKGFGMKVPSSKPLSSVASSDTGATLARRHRKRDSEFLRGAIQKYGRKPC